jgi:hypothetical protein
MCIFQLLIEITVKGNTLTFLVFNRLQLKNQTLVEFGVNSIACEIVTLGLLFESNSHLISFN